MGRFVAEGYLVIHSVKLKRLANTVIFDYDSAVPAIAAGSVNSRVRCMAYATATPSTNGKGNFLAGRYGYGSGSGAVSSTSAATTGSGAGPTTSTSTATEVPTIATTTS